MAGEYKRGDLLYKLRDAVGDGMNNKLRSAIGRGNIESIVGVIMEGDNFLDVFRNFFIGLPDGRQIYEPLEERKLNGDYIFGPTVAVVEIILGTGKPEVARDVAQAYKTIKEDTDVNYFTDAVRGVVRAGFADGKDDAILYVVETYKKIVQSGNSPNVLTRQIERVAQNGNAKDVIKVCDNYLAENGYKRTFIPKI